MKVRLLWLVGILCCVVGVVVVVEGVADKAANANTVKVFNLLKKAQFIVGQELGSGEDTAHGYEAYVQNLQEKTGKYVGLVGIDFSYTTDSTSIEKTTQPAIDFWNRGGLVAAVNQPNNPFTGGGPLDRQDVVLEELLQPGNKAYDAWQANLNKVANFLEHLQNAGVTVLWRPFQEMNGGAFWWASRESTSFISLWQQMFKYFTETRKLHNLLWVYCPGAVTATSSLGEFYPGDDFVDILGQDIYKPDITGLAYKTLLSMAKGRPIALCEFGPSDESHPAGDYDWLQMLNILKKSYPKIAYFMAWVDTPGLEISLVSNQNVEKLMNDPKVTTLDKLGLSTHGGDGDGDDGTGGGDGISGAAITGIVIGSIMGVLLLVFIVVLVVGCIIFRRRQAPGAPKYTLLSNAQL